MVGRQPGSTVAFSAHAVQSLSAVRPDDKTRPEYVAAFRKLALRIAASLRDVPAAALPIRMYVAGGAAVHFYTGERVSRDIDAAFSRRIALPEDLDVSYLDADGHARILYFDRQYNDTLGLTHEDARDDSVALSIDGIDPAVLDIRLLSPLDLAISKLSRFSEQDRDDILQLARHQRISAADLRQRATEALAGYVGSVERIRGSIDMACSMVDDVERRKRL